jgi:hypothetical protein
MLAMPDLYLIKQAEQGRETGVGQFGNGPTAISSAGRRPSKSATSTGVIAMHSLQSMIFLQRNRREPRRAGIGGTGRRR